jgi:hypothetical protein
MPSTDMTLHLLKYREAARHLWNSFLLDEETFASGTFPDDFLFDRWEAIQDELFAALVLWHVSENPPLVRLAPGLAKPVRFLKVVPTSAEVPALVSRTKPAKTYWDHPVNRLRPQDDLCFISFFDWNKSSHLDLKYYLVSIEGSEAHPELVGHEALLEVEYARVLLDERGAAEG